MAPAIFKLVPVPPRGRESEIAVAVGVDFAAQADLFYLRSFPFHGCILLDSRLLSPLYYQGTQMRASRRTEEGLPHFEAGRVSPLRTLQALQHRNFRLLWA